MQRIGSGKEKTVNLKKILPAAFMIPVGLLATATLGAQSSAPKLAILNLRLAIASTAEGKQALADFETRFAVRQKEIDQINRKINDLAQQFGEKQNTWSDEQKAKAQADGQRLTRQLDRKTAEFQADRNAAKDDIVQRIGSKMVPIVERYARENSLDTVFDSSAPNTPLLLVAPPIDVTDAITKLYDQAFPAKSAGTPDTSKPAPTHPPKKS